MQQNGFACFLTANKPAKCWLTLSKCKFKSSCPKDIYIHKKTPEHIVPQ